MSPPDETPDVAIVGAGPAGLIAAERLAGAGLAVTIFERMPAPARKFLLAGRGGLNLTHSEPLEALLDRYGAARPWLESTIRAHPPEALRAWADELGQETFIGSSGRVFPKVMKASPLLRAWLRRLDGMGVRLQAGRRWTGWGEDGSLTFATRDGRTALARPRATLLALGGASWPRLGADGSWVGLLEAEGVAVAPLQPANAGVEVPWSDRMAERFAGTPLKRVAIRLGDRRVQGEALITREGLEGGAIYALSGPLREAIAAAGSATIMIDLRPDLDGPVLAARLVRRRRGETTSNHLRKAGGLSPAAATLLREVRLDGLPAEPAALAALIKAAPLTLTGMRPLARAISTAGGIMASEIDATFMLRRRPGTFVAGEMLDWEAPTGGYLLTASMASGRLAGAGALQWLQRLKAPSSASP